MYCLKSCWPMSSYHSKHLDTSPKLKVTKRCHSTMLNPAPVMLLIFVIDAYLEEFTGEPPTPRNRLLNPIVKGFSWGGTCYIFGTLNGIEVLKDTSAAQFPAT